MLERDISYTTSQRLRWKKTRNRNGYGKRAKDRISVKWAESISRSKNIYSIRESVMLRRPDRSQHRSIDRPYFLRGHLPEIGGVWLSASDPDSSFAQQQEAKVVTRGTVAFFSCRFLRAQTCHNSIRRIYIFSIQKNISANQRGSKTYFTQRNCIFYFSKKL